MVLVKQTAPPQVHNFRKICPVGGKFHADGQTDRQTDRGEANICPSQLCECTKKKKKMKTWEHTFRVCLSTVASSHLLWWRYKSQLQCRPVMFTEQKLVHTTRHACCNFAHAAIIDRCLHLKSFESFCWYMMSSVYRLIWHAQSWNMKTHRSVLTVWRLTTHIWVVPHR